MRGAIGYTRVSTDHQAAEGVSLESQKRRIQLWAEANGYRLLDIHVDAGISGGRTDNRPALSQAIKQVIAGPHALVVYSLSRLARSTKDTLAISEKLDSAGADLVSLCEKIDTTSASGKMVFRLLAVLAEFERDLISERTKSAMSHMKRQSRLIGAVPFGYQLSKNGRNLLPYPTEQTSLEKIFQLRAKGKSLRQIKVVLEKAGILAKGGGSIWHPSALSYILRHSAARRQGSDDAQKESQIRGPFPKRKQTAKRLSESEGGEAAA